jgi:hypothetical protein
VKEPKATATKDVVTKIVAVAKDATTMKLPSHPQCTCSICSMSTDSLINSLEVESSPSKAKGKGKEPTAPSPPSPVAVAGPSAKETQKVVIERIDGNVASLSATITALAMELDDL